jgi:hypothetical protein
METLTRAQIFYPAVVPNLHGGGFLVFSALRLIGRGSRIESAVEDARRSGEVPRMLRFNRFVGRGCEVGNDVDGVIATAISATQATRIAHALNHYIPDSRGR